MSYFKRIVDRTLKADNGPIRPAITPESIPEPFSTPGRRTMPPRKVPSVPSVPEEKRPAAHTKPELEEKKRPAAHTKPELEEKPAEERQLGRALETPLPQSEKQPADQEPENSVMISDTEEEPETPHPDVVPLIQNQQKANNIAPEPMKNAADQNIVPEIEDAELPAKIPRAIAADKEGIKSYAAQAEHREAKKVDGTGHPGDMEPKERIRIVSKDSSAIAHYPQVKPAVDGSNGTYGVSATLPERETIVTINIGRIEVRAVPPSEPKSIPLMGYSPPLSLDEYLKRRMEGKKI